MAKAEAGDTPQLAGEADRAADSLLGQSFLWFLLLIGLLLLC